MRKKDQWNMILIILLIVSITGLHYGTTASPWPIHDFYRRLYYIPIILSAFHFRLRGGFTSSAVIMLVYAPHLLLYFGTLDIEVINQLLEAAMFMVVGVITGYLAEQAYQRELKLQNQVSQLKKMDLLEKKLRKSERLASLGQLASGIAHEIRNPLGIIKTISQTLHQEALEAEETSMAEGLSIIENETDRANRVIKGMLDFARPEPLKLKAMDASVILEDLLHIMKSLAKQHQVEISSNMKAILPIHADADRLKQALMNLMLNGIQSMKNGGTLTITLDIVNREKEEKQALIVIRDEGNGINEKDLPYIFDPFFTTKDGGTGLGLSVTHRIIEEHQGSIEVKSHKDEGTEFYLYLPLAKEE
ncbi:Signal transduction histidine kinase [Tindallia magadiensis]|uniref:histidine kinase n=2 Tax=Tindallia magadiensis TaxID=69895 RepID=A0A1I3DBM0_9FIRM|nr:Signal transduction histidine kinase [Tindallia magadiensis]